MWETLGFVAFVAAFGIGIWGLMRLLKRSQAGGRGYSNGGDGGTDASFLTGGGVGGSGGE